MITVFNSNNYAQQWFFDKAFTELKAKGLLTDKELEIGRFTSLDGYFAHMADLLATKANYVMIPTDEQPFVINANTRTISIPADFSKCAGVMGDDMCEIITFTIDRYFDYVDLANTNICIQWTTKNGSGISHIGLIDYETVPGKIRFGWPLTSALTAEAGNITFAVRFFEKNDSGNFVYVLNTKTASIPIIAGLKVSGDDITIEENVIDLFHNFVSNSNNPSYPIPAPVYFAYPGRDLADQSPAAIDLTTDELTLTAEATTSDNGHIEYVWYYIDPTGEHHKIDLANEDDARRFDININKYQEIDTPPEGKRVGGKQYFRQVGGESEGALAYRLVVDETLPLDEQLYERVTTLRIKPFSDIDKTNHEANYQAVTGKYYVSAVNNVGARELVVDGVTIEAMNSTTPINSTECLVPSPLAVEMVKDLPQNVILDGEAQLVVETNTDDGNPNRTFTWSRSDNSSEMLNSVELADQSGVDRNSLFTSTPGWYQVGVVSKLNRKEETANSSICRVINRVEKPQLVGMKYGKWANNDQSVTEADTYFDEGTHWTDVNADSPMDNRGIASKGDILRLSVDVSVAKNSLDEKLLSDSLTYKWYVIEPDQPDARELTIDDIDESNNGLIPYGASLGKNYLDVICTVNDSAFGYYCEVINTLAGENATLVRADYGDVIFQIQ